MTLTAQEAWDLPLDLTDERIGELKLEALKRMAEDVAYDEVSRIIDDKERWQTVLLATGETEPAEQNERAKSTWGCFLYAVDGNIGLSKYFGRVHIFIGMIPPDFFQKKSDRKNTRRARALVEAFGLDELTGAIFTLVYLSDDGPWSYKGRRQTAQANSTF